MDTHTVSALRLLVTALIVIGGRSEPSRWTRTGRPGLDLTGKMFTLSRSNGGVCFYPPSTPSSSSRPPVYSTSHNLYPTSTTYPWTTAPPWTTASPSSRGASVCVRYMADPVSTSPVPLFVLSPDSSPLQLSLGLRDVYQLSVSGRSLSLSARFTMWSPSGTTSWTSLCVLVDGTKNLVQVFRNSNMSIRKLLSLQYVWSGEPVINFPGFEGQLTDVQVWDRPLSYGDVYDYLCFNEYGTKGSVLRWSSISFSRTGNALLEVDYQHQRQLIRGEGGKGGRRGGRRGRLKEKKNSLKYFLPGESKKQASD